MPPRGRKYNTAPRAKKQAPEAIKPTNDTPMEPTPNNEVHEQHKEFLKASEDSLKQSNEPILETNFKKAEAIDHPFEVPTIEREYTTQGIKKEPTPNTSSSGSGSKPPQEPPVNSTESASQSSNNFEATPPPEDDENYAETHNPNEGEETGDPLKIPSGNAEDLVDFGANALNFIIGNFAGAFINVKIKPEYHSIRDNKDRAVDIIKQFNDSSVEKLKFDAEDIKMLKGPLVKLLQEKGIRGLTPAEELMLALAMIAAKKVKAFVEIRSESKKLQNHFDSMIRYMKGEQEPVKEEKTKQNDSEEEFTEVEEVN